MPLWQARARLIKSVVDGDCVRLTSRRQSDSEDRRKPNRLDTKNSRHPIRQALQLFKLLACNVKFSLGGFKGGTSLFEKRYPSLFYCRAVRGIFCAQNFARVHTTVQQNGCGGVRVKRENKMGGHDGEKGAGARGCDRGAQEDRVRTGEPGRGADISERADGGAHPKDGLVGGGGIQEKRQRDGGGQVRRPGKGAQRAL